MNVSNMRIWKIDSTLGSVYMSRAMEYQGGSTNFINYAPGNADSRKMKQFELGGKGSRACFFGSFFNFGFYSSNVHLICE